jgi:hypothetical protein
LCCFPSRCQLIDKTLPRLAKIDQDKMHYCIFWILYNLHGEFWFMDVKRSEYICYHLHFLDHNWEPWHVTISLFEIDVYLTKLVHHINYLLKATTFKHGIPQHLFTNGVNNFNFSHEIIEINVTIIVERLFPTSSLTYTIIQAFLI